MIVHALKPSRIRFTAPAPIFCAPYVAIVVPIATYACVTTCSILPAAVYAATSVDPRIFNEDCTIIVPIAVIEYCSAIGIPIRS